MVLNQTENRHFRLLFGGILLFFFVSGCCGLLYQVVWTRKLVLLFGTTSYAVSTVLSIFFLGLGLGSLLGGRLADRCARPLLAYGACEIVIGLWALFFILCVARGEGAVVAVLSTFGLARFTGILLRALMALILLFVPVALMGATLPLLAKFITYKTETRGLRIGALYAVNTFGAVTGCFLTGFVLLAQLGYTATTLLGAAANVVIGLLAVLISQCVETAGSGPAEMDTAPDEKAPAESAPASRTRHVATLVLAAFAVSGFCALALEVLWTRLLTIVFLGTTYAYTTMLTTLLCGLALGSAVAACLADRIRGRVVVLGWVMMLTGISCLLMLGRMADMPAQLLALHRDSGHAWGAVIRGKFALSFSVLFRPTFCFGMTFPLAVTAVTGARRSLGRDVGRLYGANTLGGVLGALAGGYVLITVFGTHWGIVLLAAVLCATGAVLVLACPATRAAAKALTMAAGAGVFAAAWHAMPEDVSRSLNTGYIPEDHRVIHYREGIEGTVAVSEPVAERGGTNRILWINRVQATASIEKGVKMNRLQGVLPLLFDREPRDVLFMCFGSGITCGTLALSDFSRIDAVEISRDVLEAAPLFDADNLGVLTRPNVVFHVDDGRNFLLTTRNTYDVITFEPMPLALAGVSTFYTQEYYALCLERLKPGGLVSQWVPLHSLSPDVVRSLVYTFTSVFPEYCAWFINADLFLVGSNEPLRIDYPRLLTRLSRPPLKKALDSVGLRDPFEVLACFLLDKQAMDAYAAGGHAMTDDRPWAEFVAPKLVYEHRVPDCLTELRPHLTSPVALLKPDGIDASTLAALERRHEAHAHDLIGLEKYYAGMAIGPDVPNAFKQSLDIDPNDYNAQYYLGQVTTAQAEQFLRWEEFEKAETLLLDALRYLPGDAGLLSLLERARKGLDTAPAS